MWGVSYSVLTLNLPTFDPDEHAQMLGVELFNMSADPNLKFESTFLRLR